MNVATINGIPNLRSYLLDVAYQTELQPEIIMTTVHDSYLAYGADLVIDRMKSHTMYDRFNDHTVRFSVDGFLHKCVQIEFTGSLNDEQYKVVKALVFMWFQVLFGAMLLTKRNEKLLMKEMDQDYYERNIELLSEINIT